MGVTIKEIFGDVKINTWSGIPEIPGRFIAARRAARRKK
jgi:hypothetical protein